MPVFALWLGLLGCPRAEQDGDGDTTDTATTTDTAGDTAGDTATDTASDSGTGDDGVVTVTCTYRYVIDGEETTGEYPGFTTTCDGWAESGEQAAHSVQERCEQEGRDAGAVEAECVCTEDTGTCEFEGGVND